MIKITWLSITLLLMKMNHSNSVKLSKEYPHSQFLRDNSLAKEITIMVKRDEEGNLIYENTSEWQITSAGKAFLIKNTLAITPWIISLFALIVSILAYLKK